MSEDHRVQISTPDPATYDVMLDLQLTRWHRWERAAGIRHVNKKLGCQVVAGDYRIRRAR